MNKSKPASKIIGIQFSMLSPEEIRKTSVVEVVSRDTYINNKPVIGGLFDPRMGVLEPGTICPTDGMSYIDTPGYFGHIELARPVFFIQHLKEIMKICRCICFKCSKLLIFDFVAYNNHVLTVTRNPFGFVNQYIRAYQHHTKETTKKGGKIAIRRTRKMKGGEREFERYKGMVFDPTCHVTDVEFEQQLRSVLEKNRLKIVGDLRIMEHKCLPDQSDTFKQWFINTNDGTMKEQDVFQRRILGLTSYFKSTQESLLPHFELTAKGEPYHIVFCEMSAYQFAEYDKIRKAEYESEQKKHKVQGMKQKKPEDVFDIPSSYRVFSRVACNFIFPTGIERPRPQQGRKEKKDDEEEDKDKDEEEEEEDKDKDEEEDDKDEDDDDDKDEKVKKTYQERIQHALETLNTETYLGSPGLAQYSCKFAEILHRIQHPDVPNPH